MRTAVVWKAVHSLRAWSSSRPPAVGRRFARGPQGVQTVAKRRLSPRAYAAAVLVLFFTGYFGARTFGLWENAMSDAEYVQRIREGRTAPYGHPGM